MVKLPDTRPEMLPEDFEGVPEAIKGKKQNLTHKLLFFFFYCLTTLLYSLKLYSLSEPNNAVVLHFELRQYGRLHTVICLLHFYQHFYQTVFKI